MLHVPNTRRKGTRHRCPLLTVIVKPSLALSTTATITTDLYYYWYLLQVFVIVQ